MTKMINIGDVYARTGDWFIGTAKRHPEALLVLAAGCALLLRGRGGSSQDAPSQEAMPVKEAMREQALIGLARFRGRRRRHPRLHLTSRIASLT
jgi:hypothetical protein